MRRSACGAPGRVGVRISPLNSYNSMQDSDPVGLTRYVAGELAGAASPSCT
jgi:N-ethylmaleimide reductase